MKFLSTFLLALVLGFLIGMHASSFDSDKRWDDPSNRNGTATASKHQKPRAPTATQMETTAEAPSTQDSVKHWQTWQASADPLSATVREGQLAALIMAGTSPAAMQQLATDLPEEQRESFLRETARTWLEKDASEAASFAEGISDPSLRQAATEELAETWGRRDPALAAAWAWSQRAHCPAAASLVMHSWAVQDAPGASVWLNSLPPSAERDATAVLLIEPLLDRDPAAAQGWIASITDPATQATLNQRLRAAE